MGGTGLYVKAEDMVKLAWLYKNKGVWNGQRILSEAWVNTVIDNGYEFTPKSPNGLIGKGGMYGQQLMFNREKNFAIAWHTHAHSDQVKRLIDFVDEKLD